MDIEITMYGEECLQDSMLGELGLQDFKNLRKQLRIGSAEGYDSEIGSELLRRVERFITLEEGKNGNMG